LVKYLEGAAPDGEGPHIIWAGKQAASLWTSNTDWRAWTWEGRVEPKGFRLTSLKYWTCHSTMKEAVYKSLRKLYRSERDWLREMSGKFRDWGVGRMVEELKKEQAA
jgi:hypothetical protein